MSEENGRKEISLDETAALSIQLAQSRLNEASLVLQLRKHQLDAIVQAVKARYEEGGKFAVARIDLDKMLVEVVCPGS